MIRKAKNLFAKGRYAEAEEILRNWVEESPSDAEALFHLALVRREQDDVWGAIEYLHSAIKAQPRNATLYFAIGNMQLAIEDYDEAEKNFLKSARLDPNNVDARNGIAFLEIRQSRFKAAEHSMMIALNIEPENVQALVFIGIALLEQGQHDEAIEYLQKAIALKPENVQAQFCLGKAFLAAGNSGFAARCFENAAEGEPKTAEFRDWLACAQLNTGNLAEARDNFRKALEMGRVNVEILTGLVKIESLIGTADEALGVMSQAVQFAPERHDLAFQFAEMLIEVGRFDDAIGQLHSLRASGHEPERVSIALATAFMKKGDNGQALKLLEPLAKDESIKPETRLLLTWVLQECGDEQAAAEQLDILLAIENPLVDAVMFRARQMYDAGDDQGVDLLRQLLKRPDIESRQAREAQILLAHSLDRAGQYADAFVEYTGLASEDSAITQLQQQAPQSLAGGETAVSAMDTSVTAVWPKQPPDDGKAEAAFIFAWPGSGRGRLLNALAQNPGLLALSDEPENRARRRERLTDRQGANGLGDLDETNIRMARRHYWKTIPGNAEVKAGKQVFDRQWLSAEMLPAIARYFPGTSVIVLTRDPRDMVVAWMQSGFKDLESMASAYRAQLELLQKCKASLPLNFIDVDYDDLCANPEKALESVQQQLGISMESAVFDNFEAATTRIPAQSGDWKNYTGVLESVFKQFD